jgi:hypothetical protein
MDRYSNPFPRPHEQQKSSGMDGRTRLLIFGGAMALVAWFAWPYVGQQLSGNPNRTGFPPLWDPLGLMPGQGDVAAAPDRRLRLPPGVGNGGADLPVGTTGAQEYPDRPSRGHQEDRYPERRRVDPRYMAPDGDAPARPPAGARRFRECQITGDRKVCGPWQDLPSPQRGYGRR